MDSTFWAQLPKPIIGLSPMDGVTDHTDRHIQKKYGQPAVIYTEFTSVEGLCHGADRLLKDFLFDETQRPAIGQIYGTTPEYFRQAAIILCELGFDGIDINMGCPAKNVAHSGAGAALIKTPKLAQEIITAVQTGIEQWQAGHTTADCPDITPSINAAIQARHNQLPAEYQQPRPIPVSVKTRIGYDQPVIQEWIPNLLEMKPAVITVHGRTLKQQYGGVANWEAIAEAAAVAKGSGTLILGNGDVDSYETAIQRVNECQIDGVLIGRATFGNPYVFKPAGETPATPTRFQIALEHAQLFEETYSQDDHYNFLPMRKHLGWYVREVPNAAQIRIELFQTNTSQEVATILNNHGLL